jgi:hypothetical protein
MARRAPIVTFTAADPDQLPQSVSEGVALLVSLAHRGMIEAIADKVRIRRQGGYAGIDVVLVLLLYFASGQKVGMRTLWKRIGAFRTRLAAVAGRKSLPSPSSVNRALEAVTDELLRPIAPWLLAEAAGIDALLRHPCVQTYDRCGRGWHLFDFDPTVTVLRHRALPVGEDLPPALRRSVALAEPGYGGDKRGDVQVSRATLQHAGSACWLWAELSSGQTDAHQQLQAALDVVAATCQRLEHPLSGALFRMDGAYGSVPFYTDCRERGIAFLTRLNRPKLLQLPAVRQTLRQGAWQEVACSGGGPLRGALDLGLVTLPPGETTVRPDGRPYEPVTVRVVVSRYPREQQPEHGVLIEGWQYELFALDAPGEAFSAADAVALYFGRAALENRFAQEDREAGLDRIYSYQRPGQQFATTVGLWVWNLRLVRGFELAPPPPQLPTPPLARPVPDERVAVVPLLPTEQTTEPPPRDSCAGEAAVQQATSALQQGLKGLRWAAWLARRPGWQWAPEQSELRCPQNRALPLTTVQRPQGGRRAGQLIFCRPWGGCSDCALQSSCFRTGQPRVGKHIKFGVPGPTAERLHQQLAALRQAQAVQRRGLSPRPTLVGGSGGPLGPSAVHISLFLPARARQLWREAAERLTVRVGLGPPPAAPCLPVLLAQGEAQRQHRRRRWADHVQRYALDPATEVQITFAGDGSLWDLLRGPSPPKGA